MVVGWEPVEVSIAFSNRNTVAVRKSCVKFSSGEHSHEPLKKMLRETSVRIMVVRGLYTALAEVRFFHRGLIKLMKLII